MIGRQEMLLTIGIPTFEGGETIATTLESIEKAIKWNRDAVEVLVSDNSLTDDTREIVEVFNRREEASVIYRRNETNIGFDRNVDEVVRNSRGRYVWLMSDDDYICDGGIETALRVIGAGTYDVVFVNYEHPVRVNRNTFTEMGGDEFFQRTKFKSGLVSSNIVNRARWMQMEMSRYYDSSWIHFAYALEALSPAMNGKGAMVGANTVRLAGHTKWGKDGQFLLTGLKLMKIFSCMSELGYSKATKRMADFAIKGGYPRNLLIAIAEGLRIDGHIVKEFKAYFADYASFWIIDLPFLRMPAKLARRIIQIEKGMRRGLGIVKVAIESTGKRIRARTWVSRR
jgi:glycosyltransferase involved in cell wall biosynthesis